MLKDLFKDLFNIDSNSKTSSSTNKNVVEQAVIIHFNYGIQGLDQLHNLENKLEKAIEMAGTGDYDGHDIAVDYSDGILYMYGQNAELLFNSVKPILVETNFLKGGKAILRFGPPEDGVKERIIEL